ncbi:MAG: hypothetical protein AW07_02424 [Candidatus Accumulibacter sp. SK-11]|nr:MAG: hypothetical protein AW07_02424 [Candidatus Accumulibacter sp. SK-11]
MAPFALSAKRGRYSAIIQKCRENQHSSHRQGFAFVVGFRGAQTRFCWMDDEVGREARLDNDDP